MSEPVISRAPRSKAQPLVPGVVLDQQPFSLPHPLF